MAKDDYHVIVYQILSYLYVQLKSGKPVQSDMISADSELYKVNQEYWKFIIMSLKQEGYISGVTTDVKHWMSGDTLVIENLEKCQITPKGIDYLVDNSFMKKAKQLLDSAAFIAPWAGLVIH